MPWKGHKIIKKGTKTLHFYPILVEQDSLKLARDSYLDNIHTGHTPTNETFSVNSGHSEFLSKLRKYV